MSDLHQALTDIRSLRRQVAWATEFRGFGPLTLSATAIFAVMTGVVQSRWLPAPATHPSQYIALWLTTGIVSGALIATQMLTRASRIHLGLANEMVQRAVADFLPAAVAGTILPFLLLHGTRSVLWMLPGLWQVLFSLGVFASCRSLPRPMILAGLWFLLTGLACISLGDDRAFSPAFMSGAYAVGMSLVALIHYRSARKASLHED